MTEAEEFVDVVAVRALDVGPLIWGPAFEEVREDPAMFARVRVDRDAGTVVWPHGADLAPETLHRLAGPTNPA